MDGVRLLVAIALPWLLGVVWLRRLFGDVPTGGGALTLGYGYVGGALATTVLMRGLDALGSPLAFGPVVLVLCALVVWGAWPRPGRARAQPADATDAVARPSHRTAFAILLAVIALRLFGLALEATTSPLSGWDAWATWAPKARVFFELRRIAPFVDWHEWLTRRSEGAYTMSAAHYPAALPLLQTWISLALARWQDSLIGLPWLGCAIALGLGFYGQARLWGATALESLTWVYLLLSLPLLDTQIAIPGSADLWMATVYGLAALAFFQWLRTRDARQGCLALVMALSCPLVKVPGVVWMASFLPALCVMPSPRRRWLIAAAAAFSGLVGVGALWRGALDLPYLGRYPLQLHPEAGRALAESALALASYHLLFYVLLGIAIVRWRLFVTDDVFKVMGVLAATGLVFVGGVYTLSPLAEYAVDYTQATRTILHVVPMLLFVAFAAWRSPRAAPIAKARHRL